MGGLPDLGVGVIRIKKRGREFRATRMGTLRELVRRGLLLPEDPVSLEGDDFKPAGEIAALMSTFDELGTISVSDDDPWRHWSEDSLDSGEWEAEEDHVLTSFLDAIAAEPTPLRVPALRPEDSTPPPDVLTPLSPAVSKKTSASPRPEDSDPAAFPGSLSAVASEPEPSPEPELEPSPELKTAPALEPAPESEPMAAQASGSDSEREPPSSTLTDPGRPQAASIAPKNQGETSPQTLPVSFASWLEKTGSDADRKWLKGFGRHEEAVVLKAPPKPTPGFSLSRVVVVLLIGVAVLGSYRFYIRTGALDSFPVEDELGVPGAPDSVSSETTGVTPPSDTVAEPPSSEDANRLFRAKALRLRNKVVGNIVPFSNAQMMEDSLFKEFQNLGVRPVQIKVDALRVRGSKDRDDQRPVQADVVVELAGIRDKDAERRLALVEERLLTTAFVLGKYATQGKVELNAVRIEIREPTPWSETYEGRNLAGLWTGRILPENLFLSEQ
ncbi:MAG TPA: hypothetical protein DIU15_11325 [Deltaproteobacteria bacterium]|nr:hypothetical protein [Deltaproteobacteria bacterium]HCP46629.1 hypothetical protein [Deltaproteobacteria bacterium]